MAKPALGIGQCALEQPEKFVLGERTQLIDLRAGDERRIDEEKRIVRGGSDEPDGARFDIGKQYVLLGLVEAMDFVNEKDGGLARVGQAIGRAGEHAAHVGDVGLDAAEPLEAVLRARGDDLRQGGFARAGRSVKEERLDAIGLYGATEELARGQDVRLPGEFVDRPRPHSRSQWSGRRLGWLRLLLRFGMRKLGRG